MAPFDMTSRAIYFGYGSNLWLHQMELRCPTSTYLGVARLNGYKWIINDRGYANVVEVGNDDHEKVEGDTKYDDVVFGLVYSLKQKDEERLDQNEGVPYAYTKENLECDFWESDLEKDDGWVDVTKPPTSEKKVLVYIDRQRITGDKPKKEYIYRMNMGIKDAIKMGVPEEYVKGVMREFIPEEDREAKRKSTEEFARRQAVNFVDEN
ncbi:hypothetical protein K469DRAFT_714480 [Zopfia rhizophila CBS 207.26]|uniref:gamma-glutamylcyclotransferase n=1 Tax=Zopfia rhizophila CBS 207.26 TaxID=1314779 RepID=A0A6A6DRD3_9PEZI|nr:hypothetical protein K469DRAFT_714480 [Zopfia rhizophila CBS 207.26]